MGMIFHTFCSWQRSGELSGPFCLVETHIFMRGALKLFRIVRAKVCLNLRHSHSLLVPGEREIGVFWGLVSHLNRGHLNREVQTVN